MTLFGHRLPSRRTLTLYTAATLLELASYQVSMILITAVLLTTCSWSYDLPQPSVSQVLMFSLWGWAVIAAALVSLAAYVMIDCLTFRWRLRRTILRINPGADRHGPLFDC